MLTEALSLLSTAGAGSITGALTSLCSFGTDYLKSRQDEKAASEERSLKKDLALAKASEQYAETSNAHSNEPKKVSKKIVLFGKLLYEKQEDSNTPYVAPRNRAVAAGIFMLISTYCAVVFLWANNPGIVLTTINPTAEPSITKFFFGLFTKKEHFTEIVNITTGGASITMLYPMVFVISSLLTNLTMNQLRRK